MKILRFTSLHNLVKEYDLTKIKDNTLLISDIDGVFFKGIFDPRELIGIVSRKNLTAFEEILKRVTACWIFSNRLALFKNFPFIKQIAASIKKVTGVAPDIYSNCSDFLRTCSQNFAIILNASKPKEESQKVVEKGISHFNRVIYIGSQDVPFIYRDRKLLKILKQRIDLNKLIFIEISPWARNSR